jgi:muconate cycloisomerase
MTTERQCHVHRAEQTGADMKITRIEPIAVALPMKKPVYMAGVEIRQADNVLVRLDSDTGEVGWGEAASAPTMTGDTVGA